MSATATPVAAAAPPAQRNGFIRFIDKVGHGIAHAAPIILGVAKAAEPILALTPFGPEFDLVVNAVIGAQQSATASIAASPTLTGEQKLALAIEASTPGLTTILNDRGVTADQQAAIQAWVQTVFQILAGPIATIPYTLPAPTATPAPGMVQTGGAVKP